jgi:hypothetical protein
MLTFGHASNGGQSPCSNRTTGPKKQDWSQASNPPLILLNVLANLKEQLQGTSILDAGNSTFQNSKPIKQICNNEDKIITHADKNLGPVGLDTETYICWVLDEHLTDISSYVQISEQEA